MKEIYSIDKNNFLDYAYDSIIESYKLLEENEAIDGKQITAFHISVAMEECAELAQAISKVYRDTLTIYRQPEDLPFDKLKEKSEAQYEHTFNLNEEIADVIMNIVRLKAIFGNVVDTTRILSILGAKLIRYRKYCERCKDEGRII